MTTLDYGVTFSRWPEGRMIKFLPWDIWAAAGLAITVGLAAIFDPVPTVFIVIYLALCAYVVVETFSGEPG